MSRNLHDLIAVAAEMRAVGYAWEAVADKVHRKPETCRSGPPATPRSGSGSTGPPSSSGSTTSTTRSATT